MTAELPIPLSVRLPPGWLAVPPDESGAAGAALTAVHPASRSAFTAALSLGGELRRDSADVHQVAEELFAPIRYRAHAAELVSQTETGDATAPGLTRLVALRIDAEGLVLDVKQCQVLVTVPDTADPRVRALLWFALTATDEQLPLLAPDLEAFVASAEPGTGLTAGP